MYGCSIGSIDTDIYTSISGRRDILSDDDSLSSIIDGVTRDHMKWFIWSRRPDTDISSILDHHLCGLDSISPGIESISWTSSCYSHIISKGSSSI